MSRRIRADVEDSLLGVCHEYAEENGLRRSRAYRDLIEKGLAAEGWQVPNESDGPNEEMDVVGTAARESPKTTDDEGDDDE